MTTSGNVRPRTLLLVLIATTLLGAVLQAAFLAPDAWPVSVALSLLMMLAATGKALGAVLLLGRRRSGFWVWLAGSLLFAGAWWGAAQMELGQVKAQLHGGSGLPGSPLATQAVLGSSPVLGLLGLLALTALWAVGYRSQRRHFTAP